MADKVAIESVERCEALLASLQHSYRLAAVDDAPVSQQIARYLDKKIEEVQRSLRQRIEIRDGRAQKISSIGSAAFHPWPKTKDEATS